MLQHIQDIFIFVIYLTKLLWNTGSIMLFLMDWLYFSLFCHYFVLLNLWYFNSLKYIRIYFFSYLMFSLIILKFCCIFLIYYFLLLIFLWILQIAFLTILILLVELNLIHFCSFIVVSCFQKYSSLKPKYVLLTLSIFVLEIRKLFWTVQRCSCFLNSLLYFCF